MVSVEKSAVSPIVLFWRQLVFFLWPLKVFSFAFGVLVSLHRWSMGGFLFILLFGIYWAGVCGFVSCMSSGKFAAVTSPQSASLLLVLSSSGIPDRWLAPLTVLHGPYPLFHGFHHFGSLLLPSPVLNPTLLLNACINVFILIITYFISRGYI